MDGDPHSIFILYIKNMKKNLLFAMLTLLLAGFWFGGASLATDYVAKIGDADCTSETPT
ncbi:hypothetical protein IKO50_04065 [bacterium]|nr:hypothetical protein [bacterium]